MIKYNQQHTKGHLVNKQQKQLGFSHLMIITIILVIAVIGLLGFVFWQNFLQPKTSGSKAVTTTTTSQKTTTTTSTPVAKVDPTADWQTYRSTNIGYSLKYPSGWTTFNSSEHTSTLESIGFIPPNSSQVVITVSVFSSSLTPSAYVDKNGNMSGTSSSILDSNNNSINNNAAYYYKYGDSSYINRSYVISHNGKIVSVSMNERTSAQTGLASVDNSAYVNQFDLLAHSVSF